MALRTGLRLLSRGVQAVWTECAVAGGAASPALRILGDASLTAASATVAATSRPSRAHLGLTTFASRLSSVAYPPQEVAVGSPAPDFTAPAVIDGEIKKVTLSDYTKAGKYVVLFFYPKDFTFVCPTEIIAFSDRAKDFEAVNTQLIAASTDTEECHLAWIRSPRTKGGLGYMQIPIIADTTKEISAKYGVLLQNLGIALRGLFIIDPQGNVRHITVNDLPIGRSVDEALRVVQAIQFHAEHGEVCPADWKPGAKTMVADPEKSLEYFSSVQESEAEWGSKLSALTSKPAFDKAIASGKPVVVDFYAPWCGKCRQLAPFVDDLVDKYPGVEFYKVDTTNDAVAQVVAELGVKALPTFKFYKGGKEVAPQISGYKKSLLADAVKQLSS